MKLALTAGIAATGLAFSAFAAPPPRVDSNNDGWITRAEASERAEETFQQLDRNDDGKLDASDRAEGRAGRRPHHRFGHGDAGERGARHERPMRPGLLIMAAHNPEADLNGDHALSLEEFRAQHLRFFDASDVNGDGRIRFERPQRPEPAPASR